MSAEAYLREAPKVGSLPWATISGLLASRRPATVLWRVGAVVIDSIERVEWGGTVAHVGEESRKGLSPLSADRDSASAVMMEGGIARIETTGLHAHPHRVFRQDGAVARLTVRGVTSSNPDRVFDHEASTASGMAVSNVRARRDYRIATVAKASPARLIEAVVGGASHHDEAVETPPDERN